LPTDRAVSRIAGANRRQNSSSTCFIVSIRKPSTP
jgi:hypothetical protein